jgi:O-acetylhomoserine (thiol)-lyase
VANAQAVAKFLAERPEVEWVSHPDLPDHPDHDLAKKLLPKGAGSIFSFGLKGGREAGRVFIERLGLFSHLANVGDAKSLVIHPASTTHQQMDAAALRAAGISEGLVRLSVGLEDPDDLMGDLAQALAAAARAVAPKAAE